MDRLRIGFRALPQLSRPHRYTAVCTNGTALPEVEVVCPGRWVWYGGLQKPLLTVHLAEDMCFGASGD